MATSTIQSSNWKYLGEVNSDSFIYLPSDWEELHLEAGNGDSGSTELRYVHTANALRNGIPSNGRYYYTGDYRTPTANSQVIFFVAATYAYCNFFFDGGTSVIANIKCRAWYR